MGEFGQQIIDELVTLGENIGDWTEGAIDTIGRVSLQIADEIGKLDDHFIALGEFAAEIYDKAANAVGVAADELYAFGDAIVKEATKIGREIEDGFD